MRKFASIIVVLTLILSLPGCNKTSIADSDINGEETVLEEIINPITQEALKLELWKRYEHNRDAYTNAKTEFIRKWTAEARMKYVDRYL